MGLLTGKYNSGDIPKGSRLESNPMFFKRYLAEDKKE